MAGITIPDIAITSLDTITALTLAGDYWFCLDELQNTTIEQTQDKEDITGKQGRKLTSLKRNKACTVSGSNGLVSSGLLEIQTGGTFEKKTSAQIFATDYLVVASNAATTKYKAVGTTGAEIISVEVRNTDGTSTYLEQAATAADGKFAYDPDTKALTFSGLTDNTEVIVRYNRAVKEADVLTNESEVYSGKCQAYIDATGEDKCGNVYHIQFYIPKADFSGEFSLEMGEDQTAHEFEFECLAGACGAGGKLWDYTIIGINTADAA